MADQAPRPAIQRSPMLWLAAAFGVGILIARQFPQSPWLLVTACIPIVMIAVAIRKHSLATPLVLAAFVFAGMAAADLETASIGPDRIRSLYDSGTISSGSPVEVEGVMTAAPEPAVDGSFLTLRVDRIRYRGRTIDSEGVVRLFLPDGKLPVGSPPTELKYGSRIRVPCELEREERFLDPGVIRRIDTIDRQGIDATATIKSGLLIEHIADESVPIPLAWIYEQRTRLIETLRDQLGVSASGVLAASMFGDRNFLDRDTAEAFRTGGTFHILVISGLHITMIGGLLLLMVRRFTRHRWIQFGVAAVALWAYAIAVGADVPVVRAAVMFTVFAFSYVIYRSSTMLNSFGLSALVLLVWRPSDLFDPSFHLTFVSVFAITGAALPLIDRLRSIGKWTPTPAEPFPPHAPNWLRRLCETVYWNDAAWRIDLKMQIWSARLFKRPYLNGRVGDVGRKLLRVLFEGVLISMVVQLWMLPLSVIYFHRFAPGSVILNLWVGPLLAVETIAAVVAVAVNALNETLAVPLFQIVEMVNWLMLALPRLLTSAEWFSGRLPNYPGGGRAIYVSYFAPLLILAIIVAYWRPFGLSRCLPAFLARTVAPACVAAAVLFLTIVFHPWSAPRPDGRLHIDFLDVGQGDSALVTFPDGRTMLIDGGGQFRYSETDRSDEEDDEKFEPDIRGIGESVVSAFLWERGYSYIDHVVGTHADADHIQGLEDVAKNFQIGSALFGRMPLNDPDQAAVNDILNRRGVPIDIISRGERFEIGGATVEVLYPFISGDADAVSDNDHSVVFRIVFGSRAFLLTGDIERGAELDLIANDTNLAADLVKVAHHGSRTSSTDVFIGAAHPEYAVISVGRTSPFGHPHPDVVERWLASGATVMTTGERGTITVSTDGSDLQVLTFVR